MDELYNQIMAELNQRLEESEDIHYKKSLEDTINRIEESYSKIKIKYKDKGKMKAQWTIKRYANEEDYKNRAVYDLSKAESYFGVPQITRFEPNLLLNEGITEMWNLICLATGTKFDNANARLGVGDSSTAEVATQTALQATTNKLYKAMDATYPQVSAQTATWRSTFLSAEANWAWNEFTVSNGADEATAKNMNRKVSAQGVKIAGQVWEFTLSIALS